MRRSNWMAWVMVALLAVMFLVVTGAFAAHTPRSQAMGVPPEVEAVVLTHAVDGKNYSLTVIVCERLGDHEAEEYAGCSATVTWYINAHEREIGGKHYAISIHEVNTDGTVGRLLEFRSNELVWQRLDTHSVHKKMNL